MDSTIQSFFTISVYQLNLFSFILGMVYTLWNIRWGNQASLWIHVVIYVVGVALYYFAKSSGYV